MARTAEGAKLTGDHRRLQLQIRAGALRDFMRIWPLWEGDERSFRRLIAGSIPLIRQYHDVSASVAAAYFEQFRRAEGVGGSVTPVTPEFDTEKVVSGLYVTGQEMTQKAIDAGQPASEVRKSSLVRVSGSVTRQVLNGNRGTIVLSTAADSQAGGYARVTSPNCCAFCALIASRGPVFSESTADFNAHDHCACSGEPSYDGSEWPGRAREWQQLYNKAVSDADAAGTLRRGTSNDLLNAFRRSYNAG